MKQPTIKKTLQAITDKIAKEYKPEKIILFGSYAWGTPHEDSDLDIFVIKNTKTPSLKRIEELDRIFTRRDVAMDFLVYTPKQVKQQLKKGDFFVQDIIMNGKVLYDATR